MKYIKKIIKQNPHITSGRKNYKDQDKRIKKTIHIIRKYFKNLKIIF